MYYGWAENWNVPNGKRAGAKLSNTSSWAAADLGRWGSLTSKWQWRRRPRQRRLPRPPRPGCRRPRNQERLRQQHQEQQQRKWQPSQQHRMWPPPSFPSHSNPNPRWHQTQRILKHPPQFRKTKNREVPPPESSEAFSLPFLSPSLPFLASFTTGVKLLMSLSSYCFFMHYFFPSSKVYLLHLFQAPKGAGSHC